VDLLRDCVGGTPHPRDAQLAVMQADHEELNSTAGNKIRDCLDDITAHKRGLEGAAFGLCLRTCSREQVLVISVEIFFEDVQNASICCRRVP